MAFGKVYCFGPTFRAEKSKTRRHLTEFWVVGPGMALAGLDGDMDLAEDFLVHVVGAVRERRQPELRALGRDLAPLARVEKPFPRITYAEALDILRAKGFPLEWGADLGGDEETVLSQEFDRPVMVHRYPVEAKAFYMKADPTDPRLALCVDVLAPEGYGDIIGGGQREDDQVVLEEKIRAHDLPPSALDWYVDLRRYGSVPHAGFGMGIERCVALACAPRAASARRRKSRRPARVVLVGLRRRRRRSTPRPRVRRRPRTEPSSTSSPMRSAPSASRCSS